MTNESYIAKNNSGVYQLINGNCESVQTFATYESAKAALKADNELQALANQDDNQDMYYDNSEIAWAT